MTTVIEPTLFDGGDSPAAPAAPEAPTARLLLPADASREEWEATRRSGIGGSDVAAILGLDKYRGPRHVYEAKHGRPEEVTSEAAEIGTEIEAFIARLFSKRSGMPIATPPGTLVNLAAPWMLANIDRYVLWDEAVRAVAGPLECKNRSEYQADEWEEGVPDAPAIQCHWYMAVGGWDVGWVAALVGGNKLRWHRIERDQEMIDQLVDFCGTWFQKHIVDGYPPPADGLSATTDLLAKLWDVKPQAVAEIDIAKAKELRARHVDLKERAKALDAELTTVENEMRLIAAEHEIVKAGNAQAWTWKQNGNFASKRFAEAEPDLAAEYTHMAATLDLARLKAEKPKVYEKYRARVLRVPAKGV